MAMHALNLISFLDWNKHIIHQGSTLASGCPRAGAGQVKTSVEQSKFQTVKIYLPDQQVSFTKPRARL